ncbi:MAG: RNA polymerase sigma factor [Terriglobales bacterium]
MINESAMPVGSPGPGGDDGDQALLAAIRTGQRDRFQALVARHQRAVYRTALAILRSPQDAEDITQETFLRALEHLDQFRGEARFSTWLTQICVNTARMALRKRHPELWTSLDAPVATEDGAVKREVMEWREDPEREYSRREQEALLLQALAGLHPSYREVVVLRDIRELSTEETAVALNLTVANVKTRLLRARLQLRDRLAARLQSGNLAAAEPLTPAAPKDLRP